MEFPPFQFEVSCSTDRLHHNGLLPPFHFGATVRCSGGGKWSNNSQRNARHSSPPTTSSLPRTGESPSLVLGAALAASATALATVSFPLGLFAAFTGIVVKQSSPGRPVPFKLSLPRTHPQADCSGKSPIAKSLAGPAAERFLFKIYVAYLPLFAKVPPLVRAATPTDGPATSQGSKNLVERDNEEKRNKESPSAQQSAHHGLGGIDSWASGGHEIPH